VRTTRLVEGMALFDQRGFEHLKSGKPGEFCSEEKADHGSLKDKGGDARVKIQSGLSEQEVLKREGDLTLNQEGKTKHVAGFGRKPIEGISEKGA